MTTRQCPFCSRHNPELVEKTGISGGVTYWYYACVRCAARGPQTIKSAIYALKLWDGDGNV